MSVWRTATLTAAAMLAFAANSLLCRLALQQGGIDPASFASVRLVSGALLLAAIVRLRAGPPAAARTDWLAAAMLWLYVAGFSFAYLTLSAGTGALILFGAVQVTMFTAGLRSGERFTAAAWAGLVQEVAGRCSNRVARAAAAQRVDAPGEAGYGHQGRAQWRRRSQAR